MAIAFRLSGFISSDAHVAASPLTELMSVLHALAEPDHHFESQTVLAGIASSFDAVTLDEFRALSPLWARFRCRVFFPFDTAPSQDLEEQLSTLLGLPLESFVLLAAQGIYGYMRPLPTADELLTDGTARQHFLGLCLARSTTRFELAEDLLRDPVTFRQRIIEFFRVCNNSFFREEWKILHESIHQSVAVTASRLRSGGLLSVLPQLSVTAKAFPGLEEVRFDKLQHRTVNLVGRQLLLIPSVRIGSHLTIKDAPGYPVVIQYPAHQADEERLGIQQIRGRLAALGSESRMELFRHISAEPITTSELSQRLGQNPAQVSRSLGILRDAGLVVSERRGKLVYHRINAAKVLSLGPDILSTLMR
jgi:DNA-binding transcriptional ArsR family regulator